jgi:methyltransferase (TIGR00027 family)
VALTAQWVAARRAVESERADALFRDPLARALAGPEGFQVLEAARVRTPIESPTIPVRTHFFDARIVTGPRQVVILAAGLDARAYRLAWPAGTRVFEIDQAEVLAHKARTLAGAPPTCERIAVPIDLREDWPSALAAHGFDPGAPTTWLVEGLLLYLEADEVRALLGRLDAQARPGSLFLADLIGSTMLQAPYLQPILAYVAGLGAPWKFGTDEPEALLAPLGWEVAAHDFGHYADALGRWPYPRLAPPGVRGVPRSFLVEAIKRAHPALAAAP